MISSNAKLNIVVVGKSGAGKSSLLNYLVGRDVFATGIGGAVTQNYFDRIDLNAEGVDYCLYDSKGIEPNSTYEFSKAIFGEIDKRGNSSNIFDWIHSVFYCLPISGHRLEDFEVSFIKEIMKKASVTIVLTKKDLATPDAVSSMNLEIRSRLGDEVQVVPVCSVAQTTRKGTSVREGRTEVLKASFFGLWENLAVRLPRMTFRDFHEEKKYTKWTATRVGIFADYKVDDLPNIIKQEADGSTLLTAEEMLSCPRKPKTLLKFNDLPIKMQQEVIADAMRNIISNLSNNVTFREHDELIDSVLAFYGRVNGVQSRRLMCNETRNAIQAFKEYMSQSQKLTKSIEFAVEKVEQCRADLQSCLFFDGDEKQALEKAKGELNMTLMDIADKILARVEAFEIAYRGELRQYGNYCIRKDV